MFCNSATLCVLREGINCEKKERKIWISFVEEIVQQVLRKLRGEKSREVNEVVFESVKRIPV